MASRPAPIDALDRDLVEVDRLLAGIVERIVAAREQVQVSTGLSMDVWLAGMSRLPRPERTRLQVAADVLPSLPGVRARFADGTVSWPVVSRICSRSSRLSPDEKATVDTRMSSAVDRLAGQHATADAVLDVFDELLAQLRTSRDRDKERRLERGEFLTMQPRLDGMGGSIYAEYGAVNYAIVAEKLADLTGEPDVQPNPHQVPSITDANRQSIAAARAQALVDLCSQTADGRPAKPKLLATVSLETLLGISRASGHLLTRLVGGRLRVTPRAARLLADAGCDLRLIVHDHAGQSIGVGRQSAVPPGWLADAVLAFNATCTCPGCRLPARDCDLDHAQEVRDDGPTDAGNLGPAHRSRHQQKTRRTWVVDKHPDQSTTWTDRITGLQVTQPSLWAIRHLAAGTHPAQQANPDQHPDERPDTAAEPRGTYRASSTYLARTREHRRAS